MKENFNVGDVLRQDPLQETLKIHRYSKAAYIPISTIEATLDRLFGWDGWQVKNFGTTIIANEVAGIVDLWVWSERRKDWIVRTGAGAAQITLSSVTKEEREKGIRRLPTEIEFKQLNALELAYPHLLSDCIKNAAKKFGKIFGRDVSRKSEDVEILSKMEDSVRWEEFVNAASAAQTINELTEAVQAIPTQFHSLPNFSEIVREKTNSLSQNQLSAAPAGQTLFEQS